MRATKRAYGLAAAGAAIFSVMALPTSEPIAADVIVSSLDATEIELDVPGNVLGDVLPERPALTAIAAESLDDDAALTSSDDNEPSALDIAALVQAVSNMQDVELDPQLRCLASAIYYEARGETIEGQLAVAQVILNRAANSKAPAQLCRIIHQPGQFSFTFDGRPDYPATSNANWKRAEAIAIIAATGNWQDVTDDALYFHANYVSPDWSNRKQETRRIGRHIFYR